MHGAVEEGNTRRLISTLEYIRDIDFKDDQKVTALHKAAQSGHAGMVELLLRKDASVEALNRFNNTPLDLAILYTHTSVVELLLEKGAS